jgi:hypothetical protein
MPGRLGFRSPAELAVVVDATGQQVVAGTRLSGGRERNCVCERWQVSVTGQSSIELVYRVAEPRAFGFYDRNGAPAVVGGLRPVVHGPCW